MTAPATAAELAREQAYFDHAYDVREAKRETRRRAIDAAGDNKARYQLKKNNERDQTLGDPLEAVAFQRIDCSTGDTYYIGRHTIHDQQGEALVYPWQAPFIMKLREATPEAAGDVVRRREFRTEINTVQSFEDLIFAELVSRIAALDDPTLAMIQDDALLDEALTRDRSPEMQDIVQTIQAAQSRLIRTAPDSLLIVQGGPGTGKTAVALHRVSWLLFNDAGLAPEDVLVVGPNPTFTRYINRVLPELGDEHVPQTDLVGMLNAPVAATRKEDAAVARLKGDDRMVEVVARGLADRIRPPADDTAFKVRGVPWRVELAPESVEELLRELRSDHYAVGRTKFREAATVAVTVQIRRQFKVDRRALTGDARELIDTNEIDLFVERVWPQLSPQAFLRDLFGSLERLVSAAGSALTADEVRLLRRQAAPRLADERWSKEDLVLLDAVNAEINGDPQRFKHIVVDEAQDLSPMQLLAVRRRSERGAMTVVGDIAQSTGHWARSSWDDVIDALRSALPVVHEPLTHGYRVPRSVMDLASRLLPMAAPDIEAPIVVRDSEPPALHPVAEITGLAHEVVRIVQGHGAKGRFVGVVCPDARRAELEEALADEHVVWKDADRGGLGQAINVVSPVASKGLEFDAVVVVDPHTIVDAGPEGHRMLYIALTRTTRFLDVVHLPGRLPWEIGELAAPTTGRSESADPSPDETTATSEDAPSRGTTSAADADQVPTERVAPTSPARRGSGRSPRDRTIAFQADAVLEQLHETVAPALWIDVLRAALALAEAAEKDNAADATPSA